MVDAAAIPIDAKPGACVANAAYIASSASKNRYRLTGSGLRWPQTRVACEADEAHLAFVDDAAELAEVTQLLVAGRPGYFVGISDTAVEGEWRLLTGAPATYLPWDVGEPNGGTVENVGELGMTGLNDVAIDDLRIGLCECEIVP